MFLFHPHEALTTRLFLLSSPGLDLALRPKALRWMFGCFCVKHRKVLANLYDSDVILEPLICFAASGLSRSK